MIDLLSENTDEQNRATVSKILAWLETRGYSAESGRYGDQIIFGVQEFDRFLRETVVFPKR